MSTPVDRVYVRVVGTKEVMCIERKHLHCFDAELFEITEAEWLEATIGMVAFLETKLGAVICGR